MAVLTLTSRGQVTFRKELLNHLGADGVIAYQPRWLGGDVFVSFDKKAVSILNANGQNAKLL